MKPSTFFAVLFSLFCAVFPSLAVAQDVVVETNIQAISRQGVLPLRVVSSDSEVLGLVRMALGAHGAFDLRASSRAVSVLRISHSGSGLNAVCEGGNKAFTGTLSVSGRREEDVLELCDKIVVAVGATYGWDLKPIFAKTRLAFSSTRSGSREIYFSNLFVRGVRQATHHKSFSGMPHWAPDGKRIFYTTYAFSGGADVYSVDLGSGKVTRFAAFKNTNNGGAVSPDGQQVALALSARGTMDIYIAPARGGAPKILAKDSNVKTSPAWSPDGKTIVFMGGPTGSPRLYTIPAQGGKATKLPVDIPHYASDPDWSKAAPNKIVFAYLGRGRGSLAIYDTKTRKTKDLAPLLSGQKLSNPVWCADGRHVVAVQELGKASFLVLLDTEGDSKLKLTRISPESFRNCYDPDVLIVK